MARTAPSIEQLSGWESARMSVGEAPGVAEACKRVAQLGLALNERFRLSQNVMAQVWDSPGHLREMLATAEAEVVAACAQLRETIDLAQEKKAEYAKDLAKAIKQASM